MKKTVKETDEITISFETSENYFFVHWEAYYDGDKPDTDSTYVYFYDSELPSTKIKIKKYNNNIVVRPVCVEYLRTDSVTPTWGNTNPRDSSITAVFNADLEENAFFFTDSDFERLGLMEGESENRHVVSYAKTYSNANGKIYAYKLYDNDEDYFYKNIKISCDGENYLSHYSAPEVLEGNVLVLKVNADNVVQIEENETKTLEVEISSKVKNSFGLEMKNDKTWKFQLDSTMNAKLSVVPECKEEQGAFSSEYQVEDIYNVGSILKAEFITDSKYNFVGWKYDAKKLKLLTSETSTPAKFIVIGFGDCKLEPVCKLKTEYDTTAPVIQGFRIAKTKEDAQNGTNLVENYVDTEGTFTIEEIQPLLQGTSFYVYFKIKEEDSGLKNVVFKETLKEMADGTVINKSLKEQELNLAEFTTTQDGVYEYCFEYKLANKENGIVQLKLTCADNNNNSDAGNTNFDILYFGRLDLESQNYSLYNYDENITGRNSYSAYQNFFNSLKYTLKLPKFSATKNKIIELAVSAKWATDKSAPENKWQDVSVVLEENGADLYGTLKYDSSVNPDIYKTESYIKVFVKTGVNETFSFVQLIPKSPELVFKRDYENGANPQGYTYSGYKYQKSMMYIDTTPGTNLYWDVVHEYNQSKLYKVVNSSSASVNYEQILSRVNNFETGCFWSETGNGTVSCEVDYFFFVSCYESTLGKICVPSSPNYSRKTSVTLSDSAVAPSDVSFETQLLGDKTIEVEIKINSYPSENSENSRYFVKFEDSYYEIELGIDSVTAAWNPLKSNGTKKDNPKYSFIVFDPDNNAYKQSGEQSYSVPDFDIKPPTVSVGYSPEIDGALGSGEEKCKIYVWDDHGIKDNKVEVYRHHGNPEWDQEIYKLRMNDGTNIKYEYFYGSKLLELGILSERDIESFDKIEADVVEGLDVNSESVTYALVPYMDMPVGCNYIFVKAIDTSGNYTFEGFSFEKFIYSDYTPDAVKAYTLGGYDMTRDYNCCLNARKYRQKYDEGNKVWGEVQTAAGNVGDTYALPSSSLNYWSFDNSNKWNETRTYSGFYRTWDYQMLKYLNGFYLPNNFKIQVYTPKILYYGSNNVYTIKDFVRGNNGIIMYLDQPTLIETYLSDTDWGSDENAWLDNIPFEDVINSRQISSTSSYEVSIPAAKAKAHYAVIAYYSDGTKQILERK